MSDLYKNLRNLVLSTTGCKVNNHAISLILAWQAARQSPASGEPVATTLASDPCDENAGTNEVWFSNEDWVRLGNLPSGTKLFTHPPAKVPGKEALKAACTDFFYWWYNQPGSNTQQGFDEWFKDVGFSHFTTPAPATTPETEWVKCPEIVRNALFVLLEQYDCENITDGVDSYGDVYASEWLDQQFKTIRRFLAATEIAAPQEQRA